jgi:predicted amidohydrolase YtcJ
MRRSRMAAFGMLLLAACAPKPADLVLTNGKIVTMDPERPQAEALAITGYTIAAVGSRQDIQRYVGPNTRVIDLQGQLATPGFIEGHGHFMGLGQAKMQLDLTTATSWDDIVALVAEAARKAKPGEWIQGRGWHQEKWNRVPQPNVEGVPLHQSLDRVSPDNPVYLTHASGHAAFVNGKALELAGITRTTANPPGGEIVKDRAGNPTGLLRETAQGLVARALAEARAKMTPQESEARNREAVRLAGADALAKGVTSFHDAGVPFATVDFYRKLDAEHALPVRLYVMVRENDSVLAANVDRYRTVASGNAFLAVRSIKVTIDGALGSHGAWMLAPYDDLPTSTGLNTTPLDQLRRTAEVAIQHDYQLATHAIGDRANREVLDIYQAAFRAHPAKKDLRWRIEHAQHLDPADQPRFAQLGVIASMQAVHATSDGPWVPKRIGERRAREGAYVWRNLIQSGAVVTNGTDTPVEDINPIANFYAAVTRRMADGSLFYPEQRMTREEALKSYTVNNAYAAFEENLKGSLAPGKLADITVLSRDILSVPDDSIPGTEVVYTILGGRIAYQRGTAIAPGGR